jgi:hypothetical protein
MSTRKTTERDVQAQIRTALGALPGCAFWRNHVGQATDVNGRTHRFGLAVGSADLVGVVDGRFVALEIKTESGALRPEQRAWLGVVRAMGGFACVVRSPEEAIAAVERARRGAHE